MQLPRTRRKPASSALYARLPEDLKAVVRPKVMDLRGISLFCMRQAECATLFGSILEINQGMFTLKSPYKENFIGSLHAFLWPNAHFSPQEAVANALVPHVKWYLSVLDIDAVRKQTRAHQINPRLAQVLGSLQWIDGLVRPTGEFTSHPEADGKPAILAWYDDPSGFGIEICGPGVAAASKRRLLHSVFDRIAIEWGLKRARRGRPHLTAKAESAAYHRDHLGTGRAQIAKILCPCGLSQHTEKCFDRLNKLADSFYRTQRSELAKLIRAEQRIILK
jgi:hypothetical protein